MADSRESGWKVAKIVSVVEYGEKTLSSWKTSFLGINRIVLEAISAKSEKTPLHQTHT
jgi:hypothetical protein